jgi:MFS family permease
MAVVAWLISAVYYLFQYAARSAPSVMIPQLSAAFGVSAAGVASIVGLFYYGYSPFSLVAGVAMDRLGPRRVVPLGALAVGVGSLLFATGDYGIGSAGRLLQGAGGAFGLIGAVYIATSSFPASMAGSLIGLTQMFGSAGGAAGQFVVGPLIASGLGWQTFWIAMGLGGVAIAAALYFLLPATRVERRDDWMQAALAAMRTVFSNPQSWLCGIIAGLLFIPTTIFDMIWGVRYLEEAHGFAYGDAVMRSASVPLGWLIGCPVLGFLSDRIGRRKPVIAGGGIVLFACLAFILYGDFSLFPPYTIGLLAGIASGAAMLPYTVIKEVNPPNVAGTATGVVNFLNFTFSALLAPVFGAVLGFVAEDEARTLDHYRTTFTPLLAGVALAIALTFVLKETGRKP